MNVRRLAVAGIGSVAIMLVTASLATDAGGDTTDGLVEAVRDATRDFRDVDAATAAGYASAGSCVSGPQEGAMGVHFVNGDLVGDPAVVADQPELLTYEQRGGRLHLLGVEYLVIVDDWHGAGNVDPPVLMGQHFQYVGSPNRYGLPAFYELHVWAWKKNPSGTFVDWNPNVSCEAYTGSATGSSHTGH